MCTFTSRLRSSFSRRSLSWALAFLLAMTLLIPSLSQASSAATVAYRGDLGDAPDSTNHSGTIMPAYPWANARFPTVFDPGTGLPEGPVHANPKAAFWLGANVSPEFDADLMPDADGITNIDPPSLTPDRDRADDGVMPANPGGISLPQCQTTQFRFIVTGAAAPPPSAFANVWFDFNRDGDWQDVFTCTTPAGGMLTVYEWAVRDQVVPVVAGSVVRVTSVFPSFHSSISREMWMRISLAEQRAPLAPSGLADGRGPANTYRYGETEDYLLRFNGDLVSPAYYAGD